MSWVLLVAPAVGRSSQRAALVLSTSCCSAALQHDPLLVPRLIAPELIRYAATESSDSNWLRPEPVGHLRPLDGAAHLAPSGAPQAAPSGAGRTSNPLPPPPPPPPLASPSGPMQNIDLTMSFAANAASHSEVPSLTAAQAPAPPSSLSLAPPHPTPSTVNAAERALAAPSISDPDFPEHHSTFSSGGASPPSAHPETTISPGLETASSFVPETTGPSSAVFELMGQIRRSRSAVDLRMVLSDRLTPLDPIALAAAMSRLTHLWSTSRRAPERAAQRQLLSELAAELSAPAQLRRCGARQLATCLHSLSELGVVPGEGLWEALLDALCEDGAALLRAGNAVDTSVMALALARLNCPGRRAWRAVARGVEAHVAAMSPQHVANTLSALARGGAHDQSAAFETLLRRAAMDAEAGAMSGRNLANALWAAVRHLEALRAGPAGGNAAAAAAAAAATRGIAALAAMLARGAVERLRGCPPTELAGLAWSLERLGWAEADVWARLGAHLRLSAGAMKPDELCTTAEALQAASARAAAASAAASASTKGTTAATAVARPAGAALASEPAGPEGGPSSASSITPSHHPPQADLVGAHLRPLFAAAALRVRELRPYHLARLIHVLLGEPRRRRQEHQQRPDRDAERGAPTAVAAAGDRGGAAGGGTAAALDTDPVLAGFVAEARAQLLRCPPSAFPDLAVLASLAKSICQLDGIGHVSGGGGVMEEPYSTSARGSAAAAAVTTAAVLDHLAAAAAPLVAAEATSAAELRSVLAAFAAGGHFHPELCTAAASRIAALAKGVDIGRIAAAVQCRALPAAAAPRSPWRQRHRQLDAAAAAAVVEVADLVGSLRALAALHFHNEAALDMAAPAVAAALRALPPPAVAAALVTYAASGAPPLALAAGLASRLLEELRLEELKEEEEEDGAGPVASAAGRDGKMEVEQQQWQQGGPVGMLCGPGGSGLGLGRAEQEEVLQACQRWRAAVLYPGGIGAAAAVAGIAGSARAGAGAGGGASSGEGAWSLEGGFVLGGGRGGICLKEAGLGEGGGGEGAAAVFPPGFDRCRELAVLLER